MSDQKSNIERKLHWADRKTLQMEMVMIRILSSVFIIIASLVGLLMTSMAPEIKAEVMAGTRFFFVFAMMFNFVSVWIYAFVVKRCSWQHEREITCVETEGSEYKTTKILDIAAMVFAVLSWLMFWYAIAALCLNLIP